MEGTVARAELYSLFWMSPQSTWQYHKMARFFVPFATRGCDPFACPIAEITIEF